MTDTEEMLRAIYNLFNARDADAVVARMHREVDWPNGMEGGRVHGRSEVREYWRRQWGMIDPHVEPVAFGLDEVGDTVVTVHQVVRNMEGKVLGDQTVLHVYTVEDGLIRKMEIR